MRGGRGLREGRDAHRPGPATGRTCASRWSAARPRGRSSPRTPARGGEGRAGHAGRAEPRRRGPAVRAESTWPPAPRAGSRGVDPGRAARRTCQAVLGRGPDARTPGPADDRPDASAAPAFRSRWRTCGSGTSSWPRSPSARTRGPGRCRRAGGPDGTGGPAPPVAAWRRRPWPRWGVHVAVSCLLELAGGVPGGAGAECIRSRSRRPSCATCWSRRCLRFSERAATDARPASHRRHESESRRGRHSSRVPPRRRRSVPTQARTPWCRAFRILRRK